MVNDLGAEIDGSGSSSGPAGEVVDVIRAAGGEAIAKSAMTSPTKLAPSVSSTPRSMSGGDSTSSSTTLGSCGDRTLANMSFDEWDAVIRVHLRGTLVSHFAAQHWRDRSKAGDDTQGRIISTCHRRQAFTATWDKPTMVPRRRGSPQ